MPSLCGYCQGVIRYRVAYRALEDTWSYFNHTMQRKLEGTQIVEMLWNSFLAFHAGEVQATCAISSVVVLQNLLDTVLVLRVVFNFNTKQTPLSRLYSRQPKSQSWTLTLSLHHRLPCHQSCPTLLATTLPKTRSFTFGMFRDAGGQSKLRKRWRNC